VTVQLMQNRKRAAVTCNGELDVRVLVIGTNLDQMFVWIIDVHSWRLTSRPELHPFQG
jgi:hypothetical protein